MSEFVLPPLPCDHDPEGFVEAGQLFGGAFCSVVTCRACVAASQAHVTAVTRGLPASDLIPFGGSR